MPHAIEDEVPVRPNERFLSGRDYNSSGIEVIWIEDIDDWPPRRLRPLTDTDEIQNGYPRPSSGVPDGHTSNGSQIDPAVPLEQSSNAADRSVWHEVMGNEMNTDVIDPDRADLPPVVFLSNGNIFGREASSYEPADAAQVLLSSDFSSENDSQHGSSSVYSSDETPEVEHPWQDLDDNLLEVAEQVEREIMGASHRVRYEENGYRQLEDELSPISTSDSDLEVHNTSDKAWTESANTHGNDSFDTDRFFSPWRVSMTAGSLTMVDANPVRRVASTSELNGSRILPQQSPFLPSTNDIVASVTTPQMLLAGQAAGSHATPLQLRLPAKVRDQHSVINDLWHTELPGPPKSRTTGLSDPSDDPDAAGEEENDDQALRLADKPGASRTRGRSSDVVSTPALEKVKSRLQVWSWENELATDPDNESPKWLPLLLADDSERINKACLQSPNHDFPPAPPNTKRPSVSSSTKHSYPPTLVGEDEDEDDDNNNNNDNDNELEEQDSESDSTSTRRRRTAQHEDDTPIDYFMPPGDRPQLPAVATARNRELSNVVDEDLHFQSHRDSVALAKQRLKAHTLKCGLGEQLLSSKDSLILTKYKFDAKYPRPVLPVAANETNLPEATATADTALPQTGKWLPLLEASRRE